MGNALNLLTKIEYNPEAYTKYKAIQTKDYGENLETQLNRQEKSRVDRT